MKLLTGNSNKKLSEKIAKTDEHIKIPPPPG